MANTFGTWADHLALTPSSGDVHRFNDSVFNEAYFDGTKWRYLVNGKEMVPPTSSTFTWLNRTSGGQTASVNHNHGGEYLQAPPVSGDHFRGRYETAPSPPYVLRATIAMNIPGLDYAFIGVGWRESSSGKLVIPLAVHAVSIGGFVWPHIAKANSPTDFSPGNYGINLRVGAMSSNQMLHFEIEDDNANRIVRLSSEGLEFEQAQSVGRGDFCTPDQIMWGMNSNNTSYQVGGRLIHWKKA